MYVNTVNSRSHGYHGTNYFSWRVRYNRIYLCVSSLLQVQENVSRIYEAITRDKDHRGPVVAAGGVRTLIDLGNNGNDECKKRSQQSLARIAISMDPNIAFSGQRACDAVRPILALLEYDKTGMETFEGED